MSKNIQLLHKSLNDPELCSNFFKTKRWPFFPILALKKWARSITNLLSWLKIMIFLIDWLCSWNKRILYYDMASSVYVLHENMYLMYFMYFSVMRCNLAPLKNYELGVILLIYSFTIKGQGHSTLQKYFS